MYIILLRFADNRDQAGALMQGHNAWLQQGFDQGVFLLAGSLQPGLGGVVLAHGTDPHALQARVAEDPFVTAGVVTAQILEIAPGKADARLQFLLD